jgi:hypothetical protein
MATTNPRAARERKQKIFVAVGGLFLVALLAFQLPKILGGSSASEAAAKTETAAVGEDPTLTPVPSATVPPTTIPTTLADTRRQLTAGPAQLRSFTVFDRKDPFVQQLDTPTTVDDGGDGSGGADGGGDAGKPPPTQDFSTDDPAAPAVTVISVNGARQALAAGAVFPAADPVFVLIAENARAKTVVVGIAGGSYASGARASKLKVGKPLVLTNTTTGARYRLVLVAVGEGKADEQPHADADKP